MKKEGR